MIKYTIPIAEHFMWVFLHKDTSTFTKATGHDDYYAVCMTKLDIEKDDFSLPKWMGQIHFKRDYLGAGQVSHEILHAVLHYARYSEKELSDEDLCETMHRAVSNFWNKYFDHVAEGYKIVEI